MNSPKIILRIGQTQIKCFKTTTVLCHVVAQEKIYKNIGVCQQRNEEVLALV